MRIVGIIAGAGIVINFVRIRVEKTITNMGRRMIVAKKANTKYSTIEVFQ